MNDRFLQSVSLDFSQIAPKSYLQAIPALKTLGELTLSAPVVFFVGENGSGKSTLLEAVAIAAGFNPEGGTRNYSFSTRDSHSDLWKAVRLVRGWRRPSSGYFLRAESFYNVATQEEEYADWEHPSIGLHKKSHGESFLTIVQAYFRENGLYLLDEPEAALSPQRQLTLLAEIHRCAKAGSQFLIATHSPILLGLPGAQILSFNGGRIHPCAYEETESYQVTRLFLTHREQMLKELLDSGEYDK